MESYLVISELFGGLVLFFGLGLIIGHLLHLNKYFEDQEIHRHLKP
jgi:hypothetical protein